MKISQIELSNFRKYASAHFSFHPQFNVLIGNNASGKTTILDAIAMLLATYFQGSRITTGGGTLKKSDARYIVKQVEGQVFLQPQDNVWLRAVANLAESSEPLEWIRELGDRGGKAKALIEYGNNSRRQVQDGNTYELPLLLYYGAGRLWELHRDMKTSSPGSQLDAYRYCLDPKTDQYVFLKWFKQLTLSQLQRGISIPALHAVSDAVIQCIPGAKSFFFDIGEDKILIELEKEGIVRFDDLSDGFRNMVAMVADISHRCSKLNPHLGSKAAKLTQGIILIDELDLHLHPKWQRRVIKDLRTAFPGIQFITTTHSPFIIQSANEGEVIDLDGKSILSGAHSIDENIAAPGPVDPWVGRSIEDIVETIMDVPVPQRSLRHEQMYDAAKKYYEILEESKVVSSEEKEALKQKLDELVAPFSDDVAYYAFLEMERMDAGLGKSKRKESK